MNNELFANINVDTITIKKVSLNKNGLGKSAYVDKEGSKFFTLDKSCKISSEIRPGNTDGKIKEGERFNLEVSVTPAEEEKAKQVDEKILKNLLENKVDFFGAAKAKAITSVDAIKPMYKYIVREGSDKQDGGKYPNTFRLKVDGWSDYCVDVHVVEKIKDGGEKVKYVKDCSWRDRIVGKDPAPLDSNTTFYVILGENEYGKHKVTDKLPVKDQAGNFVLDANGLKVWRYVGPQDVTWNSEAVVVWNIQKIYVTESVGPTLVAKQVYVKPAPKSTQNKTSIDSETLKEDDVLLALEGKVPQPNDQDVVIVPIEEVASVTKVESTAPSTKKRKISLSTSSVSNDF